MSRKSSKSGRSPAWMSKELSENLKHKGEVGKRQKLGRVTQKTQGGTVWGFRGTVRKDKSKWSWISWGWWKATRRTPGNTSVAEDMSGKLWACYWIGQETWWQKTAKTKEPNTFFAFGFQQTQAPETKGKNQFSPEKSQLRKHLKRIDRHKSMGPIGMDPQLWRELAASLQGHSQLSLKCQVDWGSFVRTERKQMTLLFWKVQKKDQEDHIKKKDQTGRRYLSP